MNRYLLLLILAPIALLMLDVDTCAAGDPVCKAEEGDALPMGASKPRVLSGIIIGSIIAVGLWVCGASNSGDRD